jgi:hypothetical protein
VMAFESQNAPRRAALPQVPFHELAGVVGEHGFASVEPPQICRSLEIRPDTLESLSVFWEDLPADAYLRDGGRYRRRRHSCYVVDGGSVIRVPHRAHWQSLNYNALHGGIERWFEPLELDRVQPFWDRLLTCLGGVCSQLKGAQPWFVEAHQFRIDTTDGIGRPTPEGAHRDGVDFVVVVLVARHGIKGGESRIFEADGPLGIRFTLSEPWTLLMMDDERVIHETTPIQPLDGKGYRDTLVLTFRRGSFQGP